MIYIDFLQGVIDGTYTSENLEELDYFWLLQDEAVEAAAAPGVVINPVHAEALQAAIIDDAEFGEISVYDLVFERLAQMQVSEPTFDPFTGPLSDRKGNRVYAEGERATLAELLSLQWAAENVVGPWEGEP